MRAANFASDGGERLDVEYDSASDTLTIEGVPYMGALFRHLGVSRVGDRAFLVRLAGLNGPGRVAWVIDSGPGRRARASRGDA